MAFTIKHVLLSLAFISTFACWSQDSLQVKTKKVSESAVGTFSAGIYWANPLGSSFVNEGLDLKPGFALSLRA